MLVALVALVIGCAKKGSLDDLLTRSMEISDETIEILSNTQGDQEAAEAALRKFLAENREEIRYLRKRGIGLLGGMSPDERTAFEARAQKERLVRQSKIENLARTYPKPSSILALARLTN